MTPDPILDSMVSPGRYVAESVSCVDQISAWHDQWVGATIECGHGRFRGVSDGLNYTQAFTRAGTAFREWHERHGFDEDDEPLPLSEDEQRVDIRRGRD